MTSLSGLDTADPATPRSDRGMEAFDAVGFVRAMRSVADVLEEHARGLDGLDGRPWDAATVDGRTGSTARSSTGAGPDERVGVGSDLASTLGAAVVAIEEHTDFSSIAAVLGDGARQGARSVAGRRLAALFAGMGEAMRNADRLDGLRLALALESGAERLATVDDGRHTGGFPAVAAAVADGALGAADQGAGIDEVLVSAADAGLEELEQGPLVDRRLAARGVVDATAAGFLLIIDSLASIVTGEPLPAPPNAAGRPGARPAVGTSIADFEVSCLLEPLVGGIEEGDALEATLHEIADLADFSIVGPRWRIDLRTRFPGAVVEALAEAGRPTEVHIGLAGDTVPGRESI